MIGGLRALRRASLALVVVCLSLAGHAAGSAMLPDVPGFVFAVIIAVGLSMVASPTMSMPKAFAFLLALQGLLHVIFVMSSSCMPEMGGAMGLIPSTVTVLGHVIASAIAVLVLRYGDDIIASWAALLSAAFGVPALCFARIPRRPQPIPSVWEPHRFGADVHLGSQVRRGPPPA